MVKCPKCGRGYFSTKRFNYLKIEDKELLVCPVCIEKNRRLQMRDNIPKDDLQKKAFPIVPIIILVVLLIIGGLIGIAVLNSGSQPATYTYTPSTPIKNYYTVTYKVTGYSYEGVSLTYENQQGGTEQRDVTLPWTHTLYPMHEGDFVYISAQAQSEYADITVEIYLDDVLVKTSTSSGDYVIATASGRI